METHEEEWEKRLAYIVVEADDSTGLATFDSVQLHKLITYALTHQKQTIMDMCDEMDEPILQDLKERISKL